MDAERVRAELEMLRAAWPDLEYLENGRWVRLPKYGLPGGVWAAPTVEVCFQVPENYPGQAPYAFYVHPDLKLADGRSPKDYAYPATTGFGDNWGKFSWLVDPWVPGGTPVGGSNLVNFAASFRNRLGEGY
jgi:hypothetical protein